MHTVDMMVVIVYLAATTWLGIWMSRRVHNVHDYFMPRRFGKALMLMHAFGTGTASDQAVTVASSTFTHGLSGIWFQWQWLFATPFYWLLAPVMRRFRAVTTADVIRLRFDNSVAVLFAVVGVAGTVSKIGLLLKGSAALIDSGTGQLIDANLAIAVTAVLFVVYGAAGGLGAAIITDFVQGLLTILFSVILLPFVWQAVGGMAGIRQVVDSPGMLSLVAPGEIGCFYIVMFSLQTLIGIVAQPHIMGVCGAGRTELDGRVGFMVGNFVKRLCTVAWCLTGIAALAWYLQRGEDPSRVAGDQIYGHMAREFLPRISPGLLGVFLAAMLAGVMSSCDSIMIAGSALFTENIYRVWVPGRSVAHYLWVARIAGIAVVAGGMFFAYRVPNVLAALKIWLSIAPMMGIPIWLAFFWRGVNTLGAWAGTLAGFASWYVMTQPAVIANLARQSWVSQIDLISTMGGKPQVYEPWRILIYSSCGLLAAVVCSLLSRPVNGKQLDRFYQLMRTPIQPDEVIDQPCTLPTVLTLPVRPLWLSWRGLEVPCPSRTSVIGFAGGWLAVFALIASFLVIVR